MVVAAALLLGLAACAGTREEPGEPAAAESTVHGAARDAPIAPQTPERTPFTVDLPGTQPRWDPRKVDDLPAAEEGTVPGLPAVIDPPESAPALADAPIDAAILAVDLGATAMLLSPAGEWRTISLPESRYAGVSLSPEGSRVLVLDGDNDEDPVAVVDVSTGVVDRVPYPGDTYGSWAAADDGGLVESADWHRPRWLTDWSERPPRRVSMRSTGRLSHMVVAADTIVATSYDGHPFSVIVADRATLTPRAVLSVLDFEGNYSPGALRPIALQDDGTVLLKVSVFGRHVDGFRVVGWEPESGDLGIVTSTDLPLQRSVSFAQGLLRRTDP